MKQLTTNRTVISLRVKQAHLFIAFGFVFTFTKQSSNSIHLEGTGQLLSAQRLRKGFLPLPIAQKGSK